jgi:hypothetical protein
MLGQALAVDLDACPRSGWRTGSLSGGRAS